MLHMQLPENLHIQGAAETARQWADQLADWENDETPVAIDAQSVERVDATGLTLLLSLLAQLDLHGRPWSVNDASQSLQEAARDMGVAQRLQILASSSTHQE